MSHSADEHDTQLPEVLIKETLTVPGLGEGHRVAVQRHRIPFLLGTLSPHVSALRLQQSVLTMVEEACSGHSVAWWQVAAAWAAGASTQSPCAEGFALDRNYNPSGPTQNHWAGKRRVPG